MITVSKQENGVLFTFQDSDKYLYGSGTIEVPFNSLSIIQDESDNITLRKSASNDIFISARYDTDFGYASKEEAVNALKEILYDEAGISEEEVQQMIDAATSGIPSSEVVEQLRTDVNAVSGDVSTLQDDVASKADSSALTAVNNALTAHTANTTVHVTQAEKNTWNGKVDEGYVTDYAYSKNQIDGFLENATTLLQTISGEVDTKVDTTTYESGQYATAQALNALQENKLDASAYTPADLSQYWTSGQTQQAINAATSGIPSSEVIEQLRTDVNTISGATENLNDRIDDVWSVIDEKEEVIASALTQLNQDVAEIDAKEEVIASALTEVRQDVENKQDALQYYSEIDDIEESLKFSRIEVRQGTDEDNVSATFDVSAHYTDDEKSSGVDLSAYLQNDDGFGSSEIAVYNGQINLTNDYQPNEGEASESHIFMSQNGTIEIGNSNEDGGTLMYIQPTGVTINDERVLTEADLSAVTAVSNDLNTLSGAVIDNEYTVSQAINELKSTKLDASAYTPTDLSEYWTSAQTQTAIDAAGGYLIDLDTIMQRGLTDAEWDGTIEAVTNERPVYIKAEGYWCALQSYYLNGNEMKLLAASDNFASIYTVTKLGSNQYSLSNANKQYVSQAEKDAWSAKQDALSAGTGISISNNVISTSGVVMSQTVTQLVKLTQAAYDNLVTKDANTLYIISD